MLNILLKFRETIKVGKIKARYKIIPTTNYFFQLIKKKNKNLLLQSLSEDITTPPIHTHIYIHATHANCYDYRDRVIVLQEKKI